MFGLCLVTLGFRECRVGGWKRRLGNGALGDQDRRMSGWDPRRLW